MNNWYVKISSKTAKNTFAINLSDFELVIKQAGADGKPHNKFLVVKGIIRPSGKLETVVNECELISNDMILSEPKHRLESDPVQDPTDWLARLRRGASPEEMKAVRERRKRVLNRKTSLRSEYDQK